MGVKHVFPVSMIAWGNTALLKKMLSYEISVSHGQPVEVLKVTMNHQSWKQMFNIWAHIHLE